MDLHLCNHKSSSRHKAHRDGYLLLFFEGGELCSFRHRAIFTSGTVFLPKESHGLFMEEKEFICIIMSPLVLSSHSPYTLPLQFCKLLLSVLPSSCFSLSQQFFVLDCPVSRTAGDNRNQRRAIFHPRHASC